MNAPGSWLMQRAAHALGGPVLVVDEMPAGILRLRVSTGMTRVNGMMACAYLVGDILVDTAFSHAGPPLLAFLAPRRVDVICLTHHHEDHSGNAGAIAAQHGCTVHLRNAAARDGEGLTSLRPYRRLWWGTPHAYRPVEMPAHVAAGGRTLCAVPVPGHSATHTTLWEESTGVVLTGDLFVSRGATAVMSHENPFESVTSLRRVAALSPRWMLTGHGLRIENPAAMLTEKAEAIERAAAQVVLLYGQGLPVAAILPRVFPRNRNKDRFMGLFTGGEFSRGNFVRACIRHAP